MNTIIGMISQLMMEDLPSEQKDYVDTIRSSGEALMTLINEVLDFYVALIKAFSEPEPKIPVDNLNEAEYKKLRILLAEDNISNQKTILLMLRKLGYRADAVANGQETLQALERQPYDVILMDVKIPEINGLEATKHIREKWPEDGPKIVALTAYALPLTAYALPLTAYALPLTAYALPEDEKRCLEADMDAYLGKPIDMRDLAEISESIHPMRWCNVLLEEFGLDTNNTFSSLYYHSPGNSVT